MCMYGFFVPWWTILEVFSEGFWAGSYHPHHTPAMGPRTAPQMPYFVNVLIKNIQLIKKCVMSRARSMIQRK